MKERTCFVQCALKYGASQQRWVFFLFRCIHFKRFFPFKSPNEPKRNVHSAANLLWKWRATWTSFGGKKTGHRAYVIPREIDCKRFLCFSSFFFFGNVSRHSGFILSLCMDRVEWAINKNKRNAYWVTNCVDSAVGEHNRRRRWSEVVQSSVGISDSIDYCVMVWRECRRSMCKSKCLHLTLVKHS